MLNPAQQQAVRAEGHLIVTACPGSGKTKVLEHRASHLLSLPQSKVLGVTFTAESAAELEARIRQRERAAGARLITGTFHKLSMNLMARAKIRLKLINDFQQQDFLRRAYKGCIGASDGISFEDAKAYVDALKAQVDPYLPPEDENPKVSVYLAYQELLRQTGSSDFADLLLVTVRGMRDGSIPTYDVPFMLVDEFQDTDRVQFEWIKEHIRQGTSVTVVGDDDQSIYEWRHAMGYKGMEDFINSTQATHVSLDTTYRCAVEIMEPAAKLIAFNEERVPKALNTTNRTQGSAGSKACADKDDECLAIATAIGSSGRPEDWAVLARTNAQLEYLERYIAGRIPVIRSGGKSFWELRARGMFLALCRAVAVEDMGSLDQILKGAGLTESQLSALREECDGSERGAVRRFVAMRKGGSSKDPVERIRVLMAQWYGMLERNEVSLVLLAMAHYIKTSVQLYNRERKPAEKAKDDDMIDSCAVSLGRASGTLANRIQAVQREREDGNTAATRLMTFHSSKGLEFPNVWIMGCEEGVIPSTNSPVEEERRLFYVGMKRAKLHLQMSYVIDPKAPASRFLGEAGLL